MYNESYEEYIRSILGYPNYNSNHFENDGYYSNNIYRNIEQDNQLETCYPEIYKIIYPMVEKACINNQRPVTSELIDELTDEIYNSVESDNEIKVNINLTNETTSNNNRNIPTVNQVKKEMADERKNDNNRQFRNNSLRDLIKILLIRDFIRNNQYRPNRPPMMRPPFPGGPGPNNPPRPPIMPRYNI